MLKMLFLCVVWLHCYQLSSKSTNVVLQLSKLQMHSLKSEYFLSHSPLFTQLSVRSYDLQATQNRCRHMSKHFALEFRNCPNPIQKYKKKCMYCLYCMYVSMYCLYYLLSKPGLLFLQKHPNNGQNCNLDV